MQYNFFFKFEQFKLHFRFYILYCNFYFVGHQDNVVVSTDGGRFDVDVIERTRVAIYWDDAQSKVRRCSWFHKPEGDSRFIPYEEELAVKLEVATEFVIY